MSNLTPAEKKWVLEDLKKAVLASRNIQSASYRLLFFTVLVLVFLFSTLDHNSDPTDTSREIVHGCLLSEHLVIEERPSAHNPPFLREYSPDRNS